MQEDNAPKPGLYDAVLTRRLAREVVGLDPELAELDDADQPHRLAQHVADVLAAQLSEMNEGERARLVAELVTASAARTKAWSYRRVCSSAFQRPMRSGCAALQSDQRFPSRRTTCSSTAKASHISPLELKKEIASADQIDLIVAFVRWYGVRLLFDALEEARRNDVPVRLAHDDLHGVDRACRAGPARRARRRGPRVV